MESPPSLPFENKLSSRISQVMSSTLHDCLALGAGPAALAAAVTMGRSYLKVLVVSNNKFRNSKSSHMHTMPNWDHRNPADNRAAAHREIIDKYKTVVFADTEITLLESEAPSGGSTETQFAAVTVHGEKLKGRKIIIATGCEDIFPPIGGFSEGWERECETV